MFKATGMQMCVSRLMMPAVGQVRLTAARLQSPAQLIVLCKAYTCISNLLTTDSDPGCRKD